MDSWNSCRNLIIFNYIADPLIVVFDIIISLTGADTPVYLTLLPPGTTVPQGKFLRERKILDNYL